MSDGVKINYPFQAVFCKNVNLIKDKLNSAEELHLLQYVGSNGCYLYFVIGVNYEERVIVPVPNVLSFLGVSFRLMYSLGLKSDRNIVGRELLGHKDLELLSRVTGKRIVDTVFSI